VSKHDTHFANMFSLVLGILIAVAVLLFALARVVGNETQLKHVQLDTLQKNAVEDRTRPFVRMAVAGQDNSALAIEQVSATFSGAAAELPTDGEGLYKLACVACHQAGIAGAPALGDKAAWSPRIAKGQDVLYQHAIQGFQGQTGMMPPKGGRVDLADDLIRMGVDYMVEQSR
jgi:cytochrome c5